MKEALYKIKWGRIIREYYNNVNDAFHSLYKTLTKIIDRHAFLAEIT